MEILIGTFVEYRKKMNKYFYKDTGMYIDWSQLDKLPDIDTLIDVGVGPEGTPEKVSSYRSIRRI